MAQSAASAQAAVLSTPQRTALARMQSDLAILCQGGIDFNDACEMLKVPPPAETQQSASAAGDANVDSSESKSVTVHGSSVWWECIRLTTPSLYHTTLPTL